MTKTLTRSDIINSMCNKIGLSRQHATSVLETTLSQITDTLSQNRSVKISSFGTFHVLKKDERVGRNPKTGQEVMITPRKSLSFRASQILKDNVNP